MKRVGLRLTPLQSLIQVKLNGSYLAAVDSLLFLMPIVPFFIFSVVKNSRDKKELPAQMENVIATHTHVFSEGGKSS